MPRKTTITGDGIRDDSVTGDDVDESTLILDNIRDLDDDTRINVELGPDEDKIRMFTAGAERLTIDQNGNVGIATSNPQSELHVNGTVLLSGSAGTELLRLSKGDAQTREIVFENEGVDIASIFVNAAESLRLKCEKNNGNMVFQVKNSNVVKNMFTIDGATLQAGVNTASPTAPFDVAGDTIRLRDTRAPSSASDLGQPGEICWDSNYLYICVAIDTWKRIALSTW